MRREFLAGLTAYAWLASATPQRTSFTAFSNSTSSTVSTSSKSALYASDDVFESMCPGATVNFTCSQVSTYLVDVRILYWLSATTLTLPPKTIEYDVIQDGSTVITTATHTKQSNITTLDMSSYVDLVPPAQSGCAGPYCITTLDPVYGTTEIISAYYGDGTYVNETITYPTPYGVGAGLSVVQTATCADGQTVTSNAYFAPMQPIPLPQTLDYTEWNVEIFSSIPGFNEAFGSLYPNLSHCSFSGFDGQPVPKVVVSQLTTEVTNAVTTTHDSPSKTTAPPNNPTTKDVVTTATPEQTATTTAIPQPTDSPIAPPPESTQPEQTASANPQPSVPSSSPDNGVGSLILCGLGGPCPSSPSPTADNPPAGSSPDQPASPAQPSSTIIYAGSSSIPFYIAPSSADTPPPNAIPLYTAPNSAIAIGTSTTLTPGGPAATISGVAISAGPSGLHLDTTVLPYHPAAPSAAAAVATFTLGSATYTYTSGAAALVHGSTTLNFDNPTAAAAVVAGTTLSLGPLGALNVDGAPVPFATAAAAVQTIGVGGDAFVYTAGAGTLVLGSATLTAGGAAATVEGGHVVSLAAGGGGVVVDGKTVAPGTTGGVAAGAAVAVFTAGGVAYTMTRGASELVVGSQTLAVGGSAVAVAGDTVSLGSSGVVVDGRTVAFGTGAGGTTAAVAVVTIGGDVYTLTEGQTTLALGSTTLTVGGPAAKVSGEVISLGSGGVVDGGSTVPFSNTAGSTTTAGGSGTGTPAQYTGSAARKWPCDRRLLWAVVMGLLAL